MVLLFCLTITDVNKVFLSLSLLLDFEERMKELREDVSVT